MYFYYVYILECSDSSYYTGITNNLEKRFNDYKLGLNKGSYTYNRKPLSLMFHQEFNDVIQAITFEKKIKGWTKAKKRALINEEFDMLQILSECRNATNYQYKE